MTPDFYVVALGAAAAGFVQGLSGFAFGLIAMSIWAWTLEPTLAAPLTVFGALLGQTLAALSVRRQFNIALLWPFILGGLAGIPLGIWLLPQLNTDYFKLILGTFLVLFCPAMLYSRNLPRSPIRGRLPDAVAGALGGITGAIGGFSGAIPTLWCTLQGYNRHEQRAVIQNFNLAMLSVTMATYFASGLVTKGMLPYFATALPVIIVAAFLGMRLYAQIDDKAFRTVVLALLTCSGIMLLVSGSMALWG